MSGGSLDYVYHRVEEAAGAIEPRTPLHRAFADHLRRVAKALHDVEWVQSGDYGDGADLEAIRACLPEGAELAQLVKEAREAHDALGKMPREAESERTGGRDG